MASAFLSCRLSLCGKSHSGWPVKVLIAEATLYGVHSGPFPSFASRILAMSDCLQHGQPNHKLIIFRFGFLEVC